ncbi:Citrate/malate-proton symporter [Raoultella terrigena]|uniref:Citrate/malate-proton symporter n=1 Tax=Raoultella terrigena TaxID=577 RepID=A0A4U9D8U2_RAOTE|nr:Citrate/malate-proton symporter [Raoultella terrigena]
MESTTKFYKSTNILYLYICCIIVGSIMSMNRTTLIQGFLRIFFPMLCGEVVGMLVGVASGTALGLEPFQVFFFIVLPIMAGGRGRGDTAVDWLRRADAYGPGRCAGPRPADGHAGQPDGDCYLRQPESAGQALPASDRRRPADAEPQHETHHESVGDESADGKTDVATLASGALLAVLLYMLGMLGQKMIGLPAPVGMLFLAVLLKLANGVSPRLQEGSQVVYKFFRTAVTYPILFAVGVAITPWQELVNAFTITNLLVIISTVSALVATGFFVGKKIGMHPIDVAIVSCCQSGQGGTGDVAILTSGNRMNLMPFAQIATRIGGAINVSLGLLFLSHFMA